LSRLLLDEPGLDFPPESRIDDPQFGHSLLHDLVRAVPLLAELPRPRVLHVPVSVPDQPAGIDRVSQQTIAAGRPATNGRIVPNRAGWTGDAVIVKRSGDGDRTNARGIVPEDPANDPGFDRIDGPQAALRLSIRPCGAAISVRTRDNQGEKVI